MNKAYRCVELIKIFSATFFSCENTSRCESYGVWKSQQIGKIDEEKRKKGGGYIACPQGTTWHGQVNIGSMWHHHRVPCGQGDEMDVLRWTNQGLACGNPIGNWLIRFTKFMESRRTKPPTSTVPTSPQTPLTMILDGGS